MTNFSFAASKVIFIPSFEVQSRDGIISKELERERRIAKSYVDFLETELLTKGYEIRSLSDFSFNGITLGIELTGYDKFPAYCNFEITLKEFKSENIIGAPAVQQLSETRYYGCKLKGFPTKKMPNCFKAWKKTVEKIPYADQITK